MHSEGRDQVITNKESQRMQYALRERAVAFGWHEQDTNVIDTDLGRSGTTVDQREGFQYLVAQIALDTVGILLAFDATRLARNCSHWYQLLDLCGQHDCLIADRDGVYDPTSINGRLLLGLKGQISELELHTIRARLTVGKFAWLSGAAEMEAAIKQMTAEGHSDAAIAEHLTATGHRSPRADKVLESTVRLTRLRLGILRTIHQSHRRHVEGFLTIPQLAKKLGISRWWISDRINNGTIKAKKDEKTKCYLFPDTPATLAELEALVAGYQSKVGCGKGHQDD